MSTGEILVIIAISLLSFATLCGAWIVGHRAADRAADRAAGQRAQYERAHAAHLYTERMRGHGLPDPSGTIRTGPSVDPDATREIRIPPYMQERSQKLNPAGVAAIPVVTSSTPPPPPEHKRRHRRYSP